LQNKINIIEVLRNLELPLDSFAPIQQCGNFEIASQKLDALKLQVKSRKRSLAKKYHPDIKGGSAEKMKLVNQMADLIEGIKLQPPRPVPRFRTIVRVYRYTSNPNPHYASNPDSHYYRTSGATTSTSASHN